MQQKLKRFLILGLLILLGISIVLFIRQRTKLNTSRVAVIKEMRALQRLETASFTIEKIIDARTTEGNAFQEFLFGDKLLLIAHGEIIAGFDLRKLTENNVTVKGETLQIALPAPEILVVRIDNEKTRVYDRSSGIFSKGERDLESDARLQAEEQILLAACEGGILTQATENAQKQFGNFFKTFGFKDVEITAPQGVCNKPTVTVQ
ncbi:MAG: DUF4230 domain-containing protein [Weeksellaceae bacterium]